jgi:hypothetical protein
MTPALTINDLLREHRAAWPGGLSNDQYDVLNLLSYCRTGVVGHVLERCRKCSHSRIRPKSCGNRHCPLCLSGRQYEWASKVCDQLPRVTHFHLVFTLPGGLRKVFRTNYRKIAGLFFGAVGQVIKTFEKNNWNIEGGFFAVLHTWGQLLQWHPHLHVLVSGGGFDLSDGKWKTIKNKKYLFPVRKLSRMMRGVFIRRLKEIDRDPDIEWPPELRTEAARLSWRRKLARQAWCVFAKSTLEYTRAVVRYLARYTSKIAISNHRLLDFNEQSMRLRFTYTGNRTGTKGKIMEMGLGLFIRRLASHCVPKGLRRIHYYGFLTTGKRKVLAGKCPPKIAPKPGNEPKIDCACPNCGNKDWTRTLLRASFVSKVLAGIFSKGATGSSLASRSITLYGPDPRGSPP